jgi:hypothetical protein
MKNKYFFRVGLGKGVNALGVRVLGFFLIPGLKPWAMENGKPKHL